MPDTRLTAEQLAEIRKQIVSEIMSLIRPKRIEKPTIAELERILNSETSDDVHIEPDGSIAINSAVTTTVGAVADKVVEILCAALLSHIEAQAWRPDLRPNPDCEWCRAGFSLTSDPPKAGRVYHVAPDNSYVDHAPAKIAP